MIIPMLCVTIFVILGVWFLLARVARLMIHTPNAISIFVCLSMVQLMAVFISMRCTLCGHFLQVAFFFSSRRRHTRFDCDWSSDVCSSDLLTPVVLVKPSPDQWDVQRGREAGAMDIWATPPSLWDLLGRVETLLRLKKYMEEQAKSVVFSLARSVDSKQNLRNGHSKRLVGFAEQLGESLGLGEEDLHELRIASWLHDIGKIGVPASILLKPGPLNAEERRIMQEHPIIGEKICAPLKSLRRILPVIRHHHEKMDGSGYPDGLRGEDIPLKARILQIADIYDALTTNRPYRGALPSEEALRILFSEVEEGWLDASVVLKFSQICRENEYLPSGKRTTLTPDYV